MCSLREGANAASELTIGLSWGEDAKSDFEEFEPCPTALLSAAFGVTTLEILWPGPCTVPSGTSIASFLKAGTGGDFGLSDWQSRTTH